MTHTLKGLLRLWLRISTGQKERTQISHEEVTDMDKYFHGLTAEVREVYDSLDVEDTPKAVLILEQILGEEAS